MATVAELECPPEPLPWESAFHALHLYGAGGIAAFGWAVNRLLGTDPRPWMPLWFCAGLLVYNLDRLHHDPSDHENTPARARAVQELRRWSRLTVVLATIVLVGMPILRGDWITLAAILAGGAFVLFYSLPAPGWRLKDVPLLKTFLPPGFVLAAVFGLPLLHDPGLFSPHGTPPLVLWSGALLFGNMLLCDVRDLAGDEHAGVMSVPRFLGPGRTERLLWLLAGLLLIGAVLKPFIGLGSAAYLATLIIVARRPQPERFYERWVEGLLYLPAFLLLLRWAVDALLRHAALF
jgi:4-hydroxybenzoate polyprenyltransferase